MNVNLKNMKNTLVWLYKTYGDVDVKVILELNDDATRNIGLFMEEGVMVIKVYKLN